MTYDSIRGRVVLFSGSTGGADTWTYDGAWRLEQPAGPRPQARTGAAFISGSLLVVFIAALSYNLSIGHPTICGCTMSYEEALAMTDEQKFAEMKLVILRDVGLLLLAIQVFFAGCCVPAGLGASGAAADKGAESRAQVA